jgi:hypothetical protein
MRTAVGFLFSLALILTPAIEASADQPECGFLTRPGVCFLNGVGTIFGLGNFEILSDGSVRFSEVLFAIPQGNNDFSAFLPTKSRFHVSDREATLFLCPSGTYPDCIFSPSLRLYGVGSILVDGSFDLGSFEMCPAIESITGTIVDGGGQTFDVDGSFVAVPNSVAGKQQPFGAKCSAVAPSGTFLTVTPAN